jgi:hypothetical protein
MQIADLQLGGASEPACPDANRATIEAPVREVDPGFTPSCGPSRASLHPWGHIRLGIVLSAHTADDDATIFRCKLGLEGHRLEAIERALPVGGCAGIPGWGRSVVPNPGSIGSSTKRLKRGDIAIL